jgi:hypothetical protein
MKKTMTIPRPDPFRLNVNPLDDIRRSTRIETVVINGCVYDRAELDAIHPGPP